MTASWELSLDQLNSMLRTVQSLGFLVPWEKLELLPTHSPTFLGAPISILEGLAWLIPERVDMIAWGGSI